MITILAEILFFLSIVGIIHTYVVFPLIMVVVAWRQRRNRMDPIPDSEAELPHITIIIAAYNEETNIRDRIENIEAQSYPKDKLHVLIGSDGSTDGTNSILIDMQSRYPWLSVQLFDLNRGKVFVLNDLLTRVDTPIVVYSDADTLFSEHSLRYLVGPFSDAEIGAVAGVRHVLVKGAMTATSMQEQSYLSIDNIIREGESALGCVIGAHGSLYAIRTQLAESVPTDVAYTDDFYLSMLPIEKGFKVVQASDAHSFAETARDTASDFRRKTRYAATIFASCNRFKDVLLSRRITAAYCFFSHRVSRWFLPFALLTCLGSNAILIDAHVGYTILFIVQLLGYSIATFGILVPRSSVLSPLFSLSAYFVYSNVALFIGFFRWLRGGASNTWTPERS